jgi:hypothetical protein
MSGELRFSFQLKPHPYPEDPDAHLEAWGFIHMYVLADGLPTSLLQWEWDLGIFAEWFAQNKASICTDVLSVNEQPESRPFPGESLAQAMNRLYDQDFPTEEEEAQWYDALFAFRERHALRFALPGARIPDIFIGCNHGSGEVSLSTEVSEEWSYNFDMNRFCQHLTESLEYIIRRWMETTNSNAVLRRAADILERLQPQLEACCQ